MKRLGPVAHYLGLLILTLSVYVTNCVIRYHLYNLQHMKNTHGGVSILVKNHSSKCDFDVF